MSYQAFGVDLSLTSTGIATPLGEYAIKVKTKGIERCEDIAHQILYYLADGLDEDQARERFVVIEGYSYGSRNSQAHAAGELGGIVRHHLWRRSIPYIDVPPTTLKKYATGHGNAGKDLVVSAVTHRAGRVFDSNDTVDALVLRAIGCELLGQPSPLGVLPKAQVAALAKLQLPEGIGGA